MEHNIRLFQRPQGPIAVEVKEIAQSLTGTWFTSDVPDSIQRDLLFQDLMCLEIDGGIASFIQFTSMDGSIHITLMGTRPELHGKGLGTVLMRHFLDHIRSLGYNRVIALTVPPDVKEAYSSTVNFYLKQGFAVTKRYNELWQGGALELTKEL